MANNGGAAGKQLSPAALAAEVAIAAALVAYGFGITAANGVWAGSFVERDPTISQRGRPSTISNTALVGLAVILPGLLLVVCALGVVNRRPPPMPPMTRGKAVGWLTGWLLLGLAQAMGLTLAATNTVKFATSRPRPGFFFFCDYAGYAEALTSGNFTSYESATVAGRLGDTAFCRASAAEVRDALSSFPSGHASLSFAGLGFLTLASLWALCAPRCAVFSPLAALACTPLVLAAYVCVSRVRDAKHFPVDIAVGAAIGAVGAALAWAQFLSGGEARGAVDTHHAPQHVAVSAEDGPKLQYDIQLAA